MALILLKTASRYFINEKFISFRQSEVELIRRIKN